MSSFYPYRNDYEFFPGIDDYLGSFGQDVSLINPRRKPRISYPEIPKTIPEQIQEQPDFLSLLGLFGQTAMDPVGVGTQDPNWSKKATEQILGPEDTLPDYAPTMFGNFDLSPVYNAGRSLAAKGLELAASPITGYFSMPGVASSGLGRVGSGLFGLGAAKAGGEELGTGFAELVDQDKPFREVSGKLSSGLADLLMAPAMLKHGIGKGPKATSIYPDELKAGERYNPELEYNPNWWNPNYPDEFSVGFWRPKGQISALRLAAESGIKPETGFGKLVPEAGVAKGSELPSKYDKLTSEIEEALGDEVVSKDYTQPKSSPEFERQVQEFGNSRLGERGAISGAGKPINLQAIKDAAAELEINAIDTAKERGTSIDQETLDQLKYFADQYGVDPIELGKEVFGPSYDKSWHDPLPARKSEMGAVPTGKPTSIENFINQLKQKYGSVKNAPEAERRILTLMMEQRDNPTVEPAPALNPTRKVEADEPIPGSGLTEEDIIYIRDLRSSGMSASQIAKKLALTIEQVRLAAPNSVDNIAAEIKAVSESVTPAKKILDSIKQEEPILEGEILDENSFNPDEPLVIGEALKPAKKAKEVGVKAEPFDEITEPGEVGLSKEEVELNKTIDRLNNQIVSDTDRQIFEKAANEAKELKNYAKLVDLVNKQQGREEASRLAILARKVRNAEREQVRLVDKTEKAQNAEEIKARKAEEASLRKELEARVRAGDKEAQEQIRLIDKIEREQAKEEIKARKAEDKSLAKEVQLATVEKKEPTLWDFVDDLTDLPKTLRGFGDLPIFRQNLFFLSRPEAWKGVGKGAKSYFSISDKGHQQVMADLESRPNAKYYEQYLNLIKPGLQGGPHVNESLPTGKAEKIPFIKQSAHAQMDMVNETQANMFDLFDKNFRAKGLSPEQNPQLYKKMGEYINTLTLRRPLPEILKAHTRLLNKGFWSPMGINSRLQLINPKFYLTMPKQMLVPMMRDIGGTIGTLGLVIGATTQAAKAQGYDVEWELDPHATDFGWVKVGKTKYDMFSSMGGYIRTIARLKDGIVKTQSGETTLKGYDNPGMKEAWPPRNAIGEAVSFAAGKEAPLIPAVNSYLNGVGFGGEDYGARELIRDTVTPMGGADLYEAYNDWGIDEALKATPTLVGIGVKTELPKSRLAKNKKKKSKKSSGSRDLTW